MIRMEELIITATLLSLAQLKQAIDTKVQIDSADQILLTVDGTQIKDNTVLEDEQDASTIVLFNRRLLQNPALVQLPDLDLVTSDMIPTLAELESMIYTCETEPEKEDEMKGLLGDISEVTSICCWGRGSNGTALTPSADHHPDMSASKGEHRHLGSRNQRASHCTGSSTCQSRVTCQVRQQQY